MSHRRSYGDKSRKFWNVQMVMSLKKRSKNCKCKGSRYYAWQGEKRLGYFEVGVEMNSHHRGEWVMDPSQHARLALSNRSARKSNFGFTFCWSSCKEQEKKKMQKLKLLHCLNQIKMKQKIKRKRKKQNS